MEQIMYMLNDYTGASSKIEYAKKGDTVKVISSNGTMVLVELNKVKFWVRNTELTSNKNLINKSKVETEKITKNIAPKKSNKKVVINNQPKLF